MNKIAQIICSFASVIFSTFIVSLLNEYCFVSRFLGLSNILYSYYIIFLCILVLSCYLSWNIINNTDKGLYVVAAVGLLSAVCLIL